MAQDSLRSRMARLFALLFAAMILSGCAPRIGKSQTFKQVERLNTELVRGISTRADVLRLLGEPDGRGGWAYGSGPGQPGDIAVSSSVQVSTERLGARDVWLYAEAEAPLFVGSQKIITVFFRGNLYDGYFWFENSEFAFFMIG